MRFVALALILLSLPLFVAWLQSAQKNRDIAMTLLGALVFAGGSLRIDAGIIVWTGWPGTSPGIGITVADTLAVALLVTAKRHATGLPFKGLLAGYLAVLALSVTYSRMPMASTFSVWDFGRVIIAFLAVGGELARPTAYRALLNGFSVGLMVQAGYVIQQKLSGVVQATGTLPHQNLLGMMTELTFLNLVAAMLEGERSRLMKLGALAGLIIVAGGGSRGTMALTGAATLLLIMLSLIRHRTSRKSAIAAGAVLMLLVTVPVALTTLKDRFGGGSLVTEEEVRNSMETAARAISQDNVLGVGANLFGHVSNVEGYAARAGVAWYGSNRAMPVHNAYLLARAETGYHGEAMLILLLLVPVAAGLRHAFRYRRMSSEGVALGSAVALGTIAVHSTLEFNLLTSNMELPWAMNIAIIASRIRAVRLEGRTQRSAAPRPDEAGQHAVPGVARLPRIPKVPIVAGRRGNAGAEGQPSPPRQEA